MTVHDFYGFPDALYQMRYRAPGAPDHAALVAVLLREKGFACDEDPGQGLDHGAVIPLQLMYPDAGVPVAQFGVQYARGAEHHVALGRALRPLRDEGVLILESGNTTHNLRDALANMRSRYEPLPPDWARAFGAWVSARVEANDSSALANYRTLAPHAVIAHPRDEHFLPLLVAASAADGDPSRTLHASYLLGSLSMSAYALG